MSSLRPLPILGSAAAPRALGPARTGGVPALRLVHPIYTSGGAISACALALTDSWSRAGLPVEFWAPAAAPEARRPYHRLPVPSVRARLHYKFHRPEAQLARRVEEAVLEVVRPGDLVYAWPTTSLEFVRELTLRGVRVAVERVNSHRTNARAALDRVYARHGLDRHQPLTPSHEHGPYEAMRETRKLELADAIVSPSPFVTDSLTAAGLDPARIVRSSYAYDPATFSAPTDEERAERRRGRRPHFVHVGSDVLRKGVGELLAAWRLADGPGELSVLGDVPPALARRWDCDLARSDVKTTNWIDGMAEYFADCDVYVLASHEEGSPIATYQALAAGLPCLVSPAGAGGVVRDGIDGFIRDPYDLDGWAKALHLLASDAGLRREMGANGRERARAFTWERVAARRWAVLSERLAPGIWSVSAA
jgi:glycosyltransferase involved in cell wall biosynthesis